VTYHLEDFRAHVRHAGGIEEPLQTNNGLVLPVRLPPVVVPVPVAVGDTELLPQRLEAVIDISEPCPSVKRSHSNRVEIWKQPESHQEQVAVVFGGHEARLVGKDGRKDPKVR